MAAPALLHGPLSDEDKEILQAILDFGDVNGYSISVAELTDRFKLSSKSLAWHRLSRLRLIGAVTWVTGQSRTLVITPAGLRALGGETVRELTL